MEGYSQTIHGLLRKRDDLMQEMGGVRARMAELSNDVQAIDRVLDSLGYAEDLEGRQPRQPRVILFYRNELRQWLLNEMRKEGRPLGSRDLAERICAAEGKDIRDKKMICDVVKRVGKALKLLRQRGVVTMDRDETGRYVWSLPG